MKDNLYLPSKSDVKKIIAIEDKKLPSFPQVAAKLLKAARDDTASIQDISKIVETDPGLSIRVLEIVNSAMYGLKRKITVLSEAVTFLGMDEIKKLALGVTVFDKLFKSSSSDAFDRLLFWRHCLSVAVLGMEIGRKTGYPEPEEAYVAGLLHDSGKIFLDLKGKKDYSRFIENLAGSTDQIIEKEREEIGLGHDDIGAFFCASWDLPEKLILAVKYHHQPFDHLDLDRDAKHLIAIVAMSNFLCWTQGIGSFDFIHPPVLAPGVEETAGLRRDEITQCLEKMNAEIDSISKFYQFIFPSGEQLRENMLEASLKLSKTNTRYYYQEESGMAADMDSGSSSQMTDIDLELGKPLAKAKTIKEVLDIVMYQIGQIFQPQDWSLLLKDQKTGDMSFSLVVGTSKKKLQGLKMPKNEGIAGYIMETGQSLVIEDVTKDKRFSERVDRYTGFTTRSIIATPLKTEGRIFGVIELINRISEDNFSAKDLKILSAVAEYAAIAIERAYYNQALTNLATKDPLTGLKNRWSFERTISNQSEIKKNFGLVFSLMVIEISGLRRLDSTQDPLGSEEILKLFSKVMLQTKRKEDELFRWSEDAFVMILPQTFAEDAQIAANRLFAALSRASSEHDNLPVQVGISPHTLDANESGTIKEIIASALSEDFKIKEETVVSDINDSLHDIVEKEKIEDEEKKKFGKNVSLPGRYTRLKTGGIGDLRVECLSINAVRFRISRPHTIQVNDFLDIEFKLDDSKKTHLKRRIVIREVHANHVNADFYNPPPYAADLGFYLMN